MSCMTDVNIEKVTVNGMTMFKVGDQISLTYEDACEKVRRKINESPARYYGYSDWTDYDPIALSVAGKILRGIKL